MILDAFGRGAPGHDGALRAVLYLPGVVFGEAELGSAEASKTRNMGDGLVDGGRVRVVWSAGLVESLLAVSRVFERLEGDARWARRIS